MEGQTHDKSFAKVSNIVWGIDVIYLNQLLLLERLVYCYVCGEQGEGRRNFKWEKGVVFV